MPIVLNLVIAVATVHATTYNWSGLSDTRMDNALNWGGVTPGSNDVARWGATEYDNLPMLYTSMTIGQLFFDAGNGQAMTVAVNTASSPKLTLKGVDTVGIKIADGSGAVFLNPPLLLGDSMVLDVGTNASLVCGAIDEDVIGSGRALVKAGGGDVLVGGRTTFSGSTTVEDGTLIFTGYGRLGASFYYQNITNNGCVVWRDALTGSHIYGEISGSGSIVVGTNGSLFLFGANSYTGTTSVLGGKLGLHTGGSCSNSAFSVAANAEMVISVDHENGMYAIKELMSTGAIHSFVFNVNPSEQDAPMQIAGSNKFFMSDATIQLSGVIGSAPAYPLIKYNGSVATPTWTDVQLPEGYGGYITNDAANGLILLVLTSSIPTWAVGDGNWDVGISSNWAKQSAQGRVNVVYEDGESVLFDDSCSGTGNVQVSVVEPVSPLGITVICNEKNFTLDGGPIHLGQKGLNKLGSGGTLTLTADIRSLGEFYISHGTLTVAATGKWVSVASELHRLAATATLLIQDDALLSVSNASASFQGNVVQDGGVVDLKYLDIGTTGYTNAYTLNNGTLNAREVIRIGPDWPGVLNQTGGTLNAHKGLQIGRAGSSMGPKTYAMSGGRINFGTTIGLDSMATNYSISLGGGTLGSLVNWRTHLDMTLSGINGQTTFDTTGGDIFLYGMLAGSGGLIKDGVGNLHLFGTNTYVGATEITSGSLVCYAGGSSSNSPFTVSADATSRVVVAVSGTTWTCMALTSAPNSALAFNFSVLPDVATAPLRIQSHMSVGPSVTFAIEGNAAMVPGAYPLVKYGSFSGDLSTAQLVLPQSLYGMLSNNVASSSIDLVIFDSLRVTVTATDATITENSRDIGRFRLSRSGSTAQPYEVLFLMEGECATNRYVIDPGSPVTIPAGATFVDVTVYPLDDAILQPPQSVILKAYRMDAYGESSAVATMYDDDNDLPVVTLTASPPTCDAGEPVTLTATASDDWGISNVQFWVLSGASTNLLATYTSDPYQYVWYNQGTTTFAAVATDIYGASSTARVTVAGSSTMAVGPGTGFTAEWWNNLSGDGLAALTNDSRYPLQPDGSAFTPANLSYEMTDTNSGFRLRGFYIPPKDGLYKFTPLTEGMDVLMYMSSDESLASGTEVTGQSFTLVAGRRCYFEVLGRSTGSPSTITVESLYSPQEIKESPIGYHRMDPWHDVDIVATSSVTVPEGGSATFNVVLSREPTGSVTVAVSRVSGDTDIEIQGASNLVFTVANWNVPQTITLVAGEDIDTDAGVCTIICWAPNANPSSVIATEEDNDNNSPPVAVGDSYSALENSPLLVAAPGVLANDTDPQSDTLSANLVEDVTNGTLALETDGSFVYTPNTNWFGTDSFTYRASDGEFESAVATGTIVVLARPKIVSAASVLSSNMVVVVFDQELYAISAEMASNYTLNRGVVVISAELDYDKKTVSLITSGMETGVAHTLTVSGIQTRTTKAPIMPGTQIEFTSAPVDVSTKWFDQNGVTDSFGLANGMTYDWTGGNVWNGDMLGGRRGMLTAWRSTNSAGFLGAGAGTAYTVTLGANDDQTIVVGGKLGLNWSFTTNTIVGAAGDMSIGGSAGTGTLRLGANTQIGSAAGTLTINSAVDVQNLALQFGLNNGAVDSSVTINGPITGTGGINYNFGYGGGVLTLSHSNNTFGLRNSDISFKTLVVTKLANKGLPSSMGISTNLIILHGGTLKFIGTGAQSTDLGLAFASGGGTLDASGPTSGDTISFTGPIQEGGAGRVMTITGNNTGNNVIVSGLANGISTLYKTGSGRWVLGGDNTRNGSTVISNGTLAVNGTMRGSAVQVLSGTLGGTGMVGNVSVSSGGSIGPGNSIGTLRASNVTWNAGTAWPFELGAAGVSDRLAVDSAFTKGTGSEFAFDLQHTGVPGVYTLVTWSASTTFSAANFTAINVPDGFTPSFDVYANALTLTLTVGQPELGVTPSSHDFGTTEVNGMSSFTFTVTNNGTSTLEGTAAVSGVGFALDAGSPYSVSPGGSASVTVNFAPVLPENYVGEVVFASNGGGVTNALSGQGYLLAEAINGSISMAGGLVQFGVHLASGALYRVEASTNLKDAGAWTVITDQLTNRTGETFSFTDTNSVAHPFRSYRVLSP